MRFITSIFFLSISIIAIAQTSEWELEKNEDGIKIYTRKIEEYPIKEFKATVTINTSFEKVIAILDKVEDYPDWMADCTYAKTIKKVSDTERYDYVKAHVPWPLSDRDMIWHYEIEIDKVKKEYSASSKSSPDFIGEIKGLVRLEKGRGYWTVKEKDNKTIVTYQFAGDPGVAVPNWLVNMFLIDGPFKTLNNLRDLAEK